MVKAVLSSVAVIGLPLKKSRQGILNVGGNADAASNFRSDVSITPFFSSCFDREDVLFAIASNVDLFACWNYSWSALRLIGQPSKEKAFLAQRKEREVEWANAVAAETVAAGAKAQKVNCCSPSDYLAALSCFQILFGKYDGVALLLWCG